MPIKASEHGEMDTRMKKSLSEKTLSKNKNSLASKMRRSISDKTLSHNQRNKIKNNDGNRFLITINVFGSAGPIRFVVNGGDSAEEVIETALKQYAREERLPILGSHTNNFLLYSVTNGFDALPALEAIGLSGARNFVLCKKASSNEPHMTEGREKVITDRKGNRLRAWVHKHLTLRVLSH